MTEGKKGKKKLKSLVRFHSAKELTTTTEQEKKGKQRKNPKELQNKSKRKNKKCFCWVTAVRVLSLAGSHSPPQLPRMPSNTMLMSGPAVGAAQPLICSCSSVFLPPVFTGIRTGAFPLRALSVTCYMFHRHRVCLVDRVGLICSLHSWWEGFGSSSLATGPPVFNRGFIPTSACGSSIRVCSWGCPGGLGFAPVRARCGGGVAACVPGVLATPGTPRGWRLGKQEIRRFRRV